MGGTVEFIQPLSTPIGGRPQDFVQSLIPPAPVPQSSPQGGVGGQPPVVDFVPQQAAQHNDVPDTPISERVKAAGARAATPLEVMVYGMDRLLDEADMEAHTQHRGVLKNGALTKFMLAQDLASKAARYMHSTKVDAEIKTDGSGRSYEDELQAILAIANGNQS